MHAVNKKEIARGACKSDTRDRGRTIVRGTLDSIRYANTGSVPIPSGQFYIPQHLQNLTHNALHTISGVLLKRMVDTKPKPMGTRHISGCPFHMHFDLSQLTREACPGREDTQ